MESIQPQIRAKAHRVCCDYLGGMWHEVSPEDLEISRFSGGYVNLTLKVSLPKSYKPLASEPTAVVMKTKFGIVEGGDFEKMTENIIVVLLAEEGLAPKVYGIFDEGRLDEYVIARPLILNDFKNFKILKAIAQRLARFHSVTLPISKDPNRFYNQCEHFLELVFNDPRNKEDYEREKVMEKINALKSVEELKWLKKIITSIDPPVVYSHGDLQINNILLREDSSNDPIHIIDNDFSGYNYRGHDFGALNIGFCVIVPYKDPPYIKYKWDNWPAIEIQQFIIKSYLEEIEQINKVNLDFEKEEKKILEESKLCSLIYLYLIGVFSFQRPDKVETNKLSWLNLAENCFDAYIRFKNKWFS